MRVKLTQDQEKIIRYIADREGDSPQQIASKFFEAGAAYFVTLSQPTPGEKFQKASEILDANKWGRVIFHIKELWDSGINSEEEHYESSI